MHKTHKTYEGSPVDFISVADAAARLHTSRWTVLRLLRGGYITARKGPSRTSPYQIDADSLATYIQRHTRSAA